MADAPSLRLAFDTGGTFTDLTIDGLGLYKSSTTPDDPIVGVMNVVDVAAADLGITRAELLGRASHVVYGTTRATNAVISGGTAKTALLTTAGHPDILLWREGGRIGTFDFTVQYPDPYIPRRLTFEVQERISAEGGVVDALDEERLIATIHELRASGVEAVAVCLLWSILNPAHELRVGELLDEHLPGIPYTLSHQLNPSIREYRRASAAAIDASLKPLMGTFLKRLSARFIEEGFSGRVLVMTSAGGVLDNAAISEAPIHTLASGPAAAPVAGKRFIDRDELSDTAIVTDAGGTSFDVSLVRKGQIPWTRETKIGRDYYGPMTGFPSVDVKSVGAGGGSIAWLDGGILRVGPQSAGADPGPACYGAGGNEPTVTDACVVLGYLAPERFLGGAMQLHPARSADAIRSRIAEPLGLSLEEAAAAILEIATERMINAIEDIAISQGVDPRDATMISGGGSGGFYACAIARRLNCPQVVVPEAAAALSAVGAYFSDLVADFAATLPTSTASFATAEVNEILNGLKGQCDQFIDGAAADAIGTTVEFSVEARYPQQIWDLEVPISTPQFATPDDIEGLRAAFHRVHTDVLGIADEGSAVETTTWRAKVRCQLGELEQATAGVAVLERATTETRELYFGGDGFVEATIVPLLSLAPGDVVAGPAIVEGSATTIVVEPSAQARRLPSGSLVIEPKA
ncbi:MAG: hydantoinase/oxoprolinase family protein [Patulibacter sp.]